MQAGDWILEEKTANISRYFLYDTFNRTDNSTFINNSIGYALTGQRWDEEQRFEIKDNQLVSNGSDSRIFISIGNTSQNVTCEFEINYSKRANLSNQEYIMIEYNPSTRGPDIRPYYGNKTLSYANGTKFINSTINITENRSYNFIITMDDVNDIYWFKVKNESGDIILNTTALDFESSTTENMYNLTFRHNDITSVVRYDNIICYNGSSDFDNTGEAIYNIYQFEADQANFTITVNITNYQLINYSSVDGSFIYNNTVYTTTMNRDGNYINFSRLLGSVPNIDDTTINITFYFNYSINNEIYNSTHYNQSIYQMKIDTCGNVTNATTLSISIKDVENNNLVTSDLNTHFQVWKDDRELYRNWTFNLSGANAYEFCIYPNWSTYYVDTMFFYEATNYPTRTYYLVNDSITNTTQTETFYLLNDDNATAVNLYLTDKLDNELENYYVYLMRKDFSDNTYKVVEVGKTDLDGLARFNLVLNNVIYRWLFKDEGGKTIEQSNDNKIYLTTLYYSVSLDEDYFATYTDIMGVSSSLSIVNDTGLVTFTYTDTSDLSASYCLRVDKYTDVSETTLYDNCLTSKTGTITYTIDDRNSGTYIAQGYIKASGSGEFYTALENKIISYGGVYRTFGELGLIATILWTMALSTVGAMLMGLAGIVLFTLIGLGSSVIMQIVSIPWTIFLSLMILGGVIIWKIKS